ncbi:MAG: hypothetical protein QNJ37_18105 [Crocosphaera sp.]|nr:hypothetical protein [Crocosphaera sp.]
MEQKELFDNPDISEPRYSDYYGMRDWELDTDKKVFCNPRGSPNNASSEDFKKVFDNPRNISELAVSEYQPGGSAGKTKKYFRFSYKEKGKTKHIHIKGGNTESQLARKRKGLIEAWIREEIPLEKIIDWIKEW